MDNALHTGAVVDDPWNEELVRVGNMVFPSAEVRLLTYPTTLKLDHQTLDDALCRCLAKALKTRLSL